jgi:UDP-GlcNAc:undecaprenyl-phosphate GlcNAc-1-phosphate transferase
MSLAIPLLDTAIAMLRRFLSNKPVFGADRDHIHHRLLKKGFTPRRAVLVLYSVAGLGAAFSLVQESAGNPFGGIVIILFCLASWIGVQHLGYLEFDLARKFFLTGALRQIIGVQVRIQEFGRELGAAQSLEEARSVLIKSHVELGFCGLQIDLNQLACPHFETGKISAECWQIRIPIPCQRDTPEAAHLAPQQVVLFRDTRSKVHPIVFGETAEVIAKRFGELLSAAAISGVVATSTPIASRMGSLMEPVAVESESRL